MKATEQTPTSVSQIQRKSASSFFGQTSEQEQPFFAGKEGVNTGSFFSPAQLSKGLKPLESSSRPTVQAKLTIGQPNDKYEQEADTMADKVVQRLSNSETATPKTPPSVSAPILRTSAIEKENVQKKEEDKQPEDVPELQKSPVSPIGEDEGLQMKCMDCEEEDKKHVQRKENGETTDTSTIESRLSATKGGGSSLPNETRSGMESAFGADFSGVRVHTGGEATQLSQDLNAQAFTHGNNVYFNSGKYNPSSTEGSRLLAHELTHTVQQGDVDIQRFGFDEHLELGDEATQEQHGQTKMVQLADDYFIPFREVVALGGDHFESIAQMREFAANNGKGAGTREEIEYLRYKQIQKEKDEKKEKAGIAVTKPSFSDAAVKAADKRYYDLALTNRSHFLNPTVTDLSKPATEKGNDLSKEWQFEWFKFKSINKPNNANSGYRLNHFQAIAEAYMAGQAGKSIDTAMAVEAFGHHFLTDAFSSGHIYTPREDILTYWYDKVPMFNENLKGYMAEQIAKKLNDISWKGWIASVDLFYETSPWGALPFIPEKGTYKTVSELISSKGNITFGDLVSGALHDYYNLHGMVAVINGEKKRVFGDGYLNGVKDNNGQVIKENEGRSSIIKAMKLSLQDVYKAWEAGSKQEIPINAVASLLKDGVFESEKFLPVSIPESELSEADKPIKWDYPTATALLGDPKVSSAIEIFVKSKASEFNATAEDLTDADQKQAFKEAVIAKMNAEPVKVIQEVINWTPDTGGGINGHNQDDNAVDYYDKVKKEELPTLTNEQRSRMIKDITDGTINYVSSNEEDIIMSLFETAKPSDRPLIYKQVEKREWKGDWVEGWWVNDDEIWNSLSKSKLKKLRNLINEGSQV